MTFYELWMIFGQLTLLEGVLIVSVVVFLLLIVRWVLLSKDAKNDRR